nr:tafazzin homolog [Aedes albopictus]
MNSKPPSMNGVAAAAAGAQPLIQYNIDWIFPKLRKPSRLWHIASTGVIGLVGFFSKIVIGKWPRSISFLSSAEGLI